MPFSAGCAGVGVRTGSVRLMTCGSSSSPVNGSSRRLPSGSSSIRASLEREGFPSGSGVPSMSGSSLSAWAVSVSGSSSAGSSVKGALSRFWGEAACFGSSVNGASPEAVSGSDNVSGLVMGVGSPTHSSRSSAGMAFRGAGVSERRGTESCSESGRFSASFSCVGISSGASTCRAVF